MSLTLAFALPPSQSISEYNICGTGPASTVLIDSIIVCFSKISPHFSAHRHKLEALFNIVRAIAWFSRRLSWPLRTPNHALHTRCYAQVIKLARLIANIGFTLRPYRALIASRQPVPIGIPPSPQ